MDKLGIRKSLFSDMGDYARMTRAEKLRKKYGTGSPSLDEAAAGTDEAVESAQLPKSGKSGVSITITEGLKDVGKDADEWQRQNAEALEMLAEDEEKRGMR